MNKPIKILSLLCCASVAVIAAGLGGCSILLPILEGGETSGGGSGGGGGTSSGGVAGTYTFDLTEYDPEWYMTDDDGNAKIVDQSLWSVTAAVDAYARNTLVLSEDGTYALTKEMGAGPDAVARWGSDGDLNFNKYTYHGTYTVGSGNNVVTLSECTSLDVETDIFEMSLGYNLGNTVIPYTEGITDLTQTAGTTSGDLVVDLIYGPYIVNSGRGNCSQSVTLGTYEWGTFTFNESDDTDTPAQPEEPDEPETEGYTMTGAANPDITFKLDTEGNYTFAWAVNGVEETGTYTWDRKTQTLVISKSDGATITATTENGEFSFKYVAVVSEQLTQEYTGNADELEAVICDVMYSFIPAEDGEVSLDLYSDGTYTYRDGEVRETGGYEWDGIENVLTLTKPDEANTVIATTLSGNILKLEYTSVTDAESTQSFVGSLAIMIETMPDPLQFLYAFTPQDNENITLNLYKNGIYIFAFSTYNVSFEGKWTYSDGELVIYALDGTTPVEISANGDMISFRFDAGNGLNQEYTGSRAVLDVLLGGEKPVYSFTPKDNENITLDLYADNTYVFAFSTYNVSFSGKWSYGDGGLVIYALDGTTPVEISENGDTISFRFDAGNGLNQEYTGSLSELEKAVSGPVYTFEGLANGSIMFELYADGTYAFRWDAYSIDERGWYRWYAESDTLAIVQSMPDGSYRVILSTLDEGNVTFTYYLSSSDQLKQEYSAESGALSGVLDKYAFDAPAGAESGGAESGDEGV